MQEKIHPEYKQAKVACSCGNTFEVGTTLGQESFHIEVCNKCHPYYTGSQKIVDTQGRVDTFKNRYSGFGALTRKKKE